MHYLLTASDILPRILRAVDRLIPNVVWMAALSLIVCAKMMTQPL
jgi:hypothetical protein